MIKMTGQSKEGRTLVTLGLSEGNLKRLREGKPIHIFGAEMDIPVDICIFWGETEEKLVEMVRPFISPETRVRDMQKEAKQ